MTNEFKKVKNDNETRYVLETATAGATSAGVVATAPGKKRENSILAQEANKKKETDKPRNFVAKNAKMGGAGKMQDKSKIIPRKEKHKKPVAESFNGEYDDEAGMAHSNLLTTARAVMGLLKTIKDRDNLPEWGQEKIAKAEMMLVSVWDYLQSQKELGNDPQVEGYGRYDRRDAYQRDYDHSVAGMDRGNNHRDDERHDLDPSDWYIVKDGKMYKVSVYPNQEQEAMSRGYSRTRDEAKAKASKQGVAEGSAHGYNVAKWYEKNGDQIKLTRWLRKEAGLPKDAPVYFDDADLVYGDKTIVPGALVNPKLKFNDLLTALTQATGGQGKQNVDGVYRESGVAEVSPPGWEKTVKAMKKHDNIDNPFALAWSMKNKGYKSHKKESADSYFESLRAKVEELAKK